MHSYWMQHSYTITALHIHCGRAACYNRPHRHRAQHSGITLDKSYNQEQGPLLPLMGLSPQVAQHSCITGSSQTVQQRGNAKQQAAPGSSSCTATLERCMWLHWSDCRHRGLKLAVAELAAPV